MPLISSFLILIMLAAAAAALAFDDLLSSIIAAGLVSLTAAVLFYFLKAPDVAMTEAAIGAGLTTAIFVLALFKTERGKSE
ncbi:Membrane bound protein complex subunit mbxD [Halanaerobium saccharolyticum]|uniref:Membrane bound protein complex subunit mbxD n=1 Tax=Halanaerobium saccharolyticum TaxID=43595 RepID=A0A4V3CE56_9FIRM|nr:hydrogenase subunit MbhD domain-containing protein [Halanaerobium saccharolyticum]TDO84617.1 Membrane bound protein complex subunit mbxD [Halanaerobium saccharolyticum]